MDITNAKKHGYGDFGILGKQYDHGRRNYPKEIIDFCFAESSHQEKILDVGCGTGIATRQLKERLGNMGTIIGTDIDEKMLEQARTHHDSISYLHMPAEDLSFDDKTFSLVTAFGAFHWFTNEKAVNEILRVLIPGGYFCAINKTNGFTPMIRGIIEQIIQTKVPNIKESYDPKKTLGRHGFKGVEEYVVETQETFSIDGALARYRSMSFSNLVPETKRDEVEEELRNSFAKLANEDGIITVLERAVAVRGVR